MANRNRTYPEDRKRESWINEYWRPAAAITYLVICICDFIIFPLLFGMKETNVHDLALAVKGLDPQVAAVLVAPHPQWQPLTLMGNGFFHIAFGTIIGITAWTRGAAQIEDIRSSYFGGGTQPSPYPQPYPYPYPYPPPHHRKKSDDSGDIDNPAANGNGQVDNPDSDQ